MFDKKEYYQRNKVRERLKGKKRMANIYRKNLLTWENFIPKKTNCQVCSKQIFFHCKNKKDAIHFDHRKENTPISISPTHWLRKNPRNIETEKTWNECNFGLLCLDCNRMLPTKNREQFIKNAFIYIFPMPL